MSSNSFSLVVATKNRPTELARLLKSVCESGFSDIEIIVVDQSNDPVFEQNRRQLSRIERCIHSRDHGTGLSRARNIGLKMVSGRIVCFPDDDCWYPDGLFERVLSFFNNNDYDFLCGSYKEPHHGSTKAGAIDRKISYLSRKIGGISSVGIFIDTSRVEKSYLVFDENLGAGTDLPWGEELDLILSLIRKGYVGWQDTSYYVFHPVIRPRALIEPKHDAHLYVSVKNLKVPYVFYRFLFSFVKDLILLVQTKRRVALKARVRAIYRYVRHSKEMKLSQKW